jgi:hypothetical protein
LQHTPSAQKPDKHPLEVLHAPAMLVFAAHVPALQKAPVAQSPSCVHDVLHAPDTHFDGAQSTPLGFIAH